MEKIALYCRVSTINQSKAETIDTQVNALNSVYKGRNVVQLYKEQVSGSETNRPVLNRLMEDAKKGLIDTVAVYHLDRLSRSTAFYYYLKDNFFKKYKIAFEVMGRPMTDSPDDLLRGGFDALIAEAMKLRIVKGMYDGKIRKADDKELLGCRPPYGYSLIKVNRNEKKAAEYVIEPTESRMVQNMFDIYLQESSIRQTAKKMQKLGVIGRNGKPIDVKTVAKMLRNETYIGNHYWGRTYACEAQYHIKKERKNKLSGRIVRPREEWKLIPVAPIVDKNIFDKVQKMLAKKKSEYHRETKYQFLCQGIIKCVDCGRTYFGKHKSRSQRQRCAGASHFAYICPQRYGNKLGEQHCHSREMSVRKLDKAVWDYVASLATNPEQVKESVMFLFEENKTKEDENRNVFNSLIKQRDEVKKQKSKLLDLYVDGRYSKEDLDSKLGEINSKEEILLKDIKEIETKLEQIKYNKVLDKEIQEYLVQFKEGVENYTFEERKGFVKRLVKEINIQKDGKIVINGILPPVLNMRKNQEVGSEVSGVVEDTQYLFKLPMGTRL
jgi:site-specific DNA recombinase